MFWASCFGGQGHFFKRVAPGARAALTKRLGEGSKGVVAAVLMLSLVLMIFGYSSTEFVHVYAPPSWGIHLNNLLMLAAVALLGAGSSKGRARTLLRHPMLMGVVVWAVAHLLVNGDLASVVLFLGIGAWAVVSMFVINAAEGPWQRPEAGPMSGDIRLAIITLGVFAGISLLHWLLGRWPFPG